MEFKYLSIPENSVFLVSLNSGISIPENGKTKNKALDNQGL